MGIAQLVQAVEDNIWENLLMLIADLVSKVCLIIIAGHTMLLKRLNPMLLHILVGEHLYLELIIFHEVAGRALKVVLSMANGA